MPVGCARGKLHGSIRRTLIAVLLDYMPLMILLWSAPLRSVMVIIVLLNDARYGRSPLSLGMIYITLRRRLLSERQFRGRGSDVVSDERLFTYGRSSLERLLCVLRLRHVRGQQVAWRACGIG